MSLLGLVGTEATRGTHWSSGLRGHELSLLRTQIIWSDGYTQVTIYHLELTLLTHAEWAVLMLSAIQQLASDSKLR